MLGQKDSVQLIYSYVEALQGTENFDFQLKTASLSKIMNFSVLLAKLVALSYSMKEVRHIQILVNYCLQWELHLKMCEKLVGY